MATRILSASLQGAAFVACTLTTQKQMIDILPSVAQIIEDFKLTSRRNTGLIATLTQMWGSYNDKAIIAPRLQDLYTRRQVCWNLQTGVWDAVDYTQNGTTDKRDQYFQHFKALYDEYNAEIIRIEHRTAASLPVTGGVMGALPPISRRPGRLGATFPGGPCGPWRRPGGW